MGLHGLGALPVLPTGSRTDKVERHLILYDKHLEMAGAPNAWNHGKTMGKWRLTVPSGKLWHNDTERSWNASDRTMENHGAFLDGKTHVISIGPWLQQLCNKLLEGKIDMDREQLKTQGTWHTFMVFFLLSMFTYTNKLANITRPTVQSRAPKR